MTYSQKLKDPRWQKKRLEIMQRDEFSCQICHSKVDTLNVHHRHYIVGREPWDYPSELLVTLCQPCHKKEEDVFKDPVELVRSLHFWGIFNCQIVDVFNKIIDDKIKLSDGKR